MVKAIAQLAASVGTSTMAELVGDERTLGMLRAFRVDFARGYHVGRPRPVAEI